MRRRAVAFLAIVAASVLAACDTTTAEQAKPAAVTAPLKSKKVSPEERIDALSRAAVWQPPQVPVAQARFDGDPRQPKQLECTFLITELGGTAPKFDCRLENGEKVRIKYGRSPEIPSEVASARLLHALGFGADEVMLVEKVRCYGCPAEPFLTMKGLGIAGAEKLYAKVQDTGEFKDFEWAAVERKHYGRPIETDDLEGWSFFELDLIDAKKGGAPRAHVDALRLLAVLMAHWDNKSENQRLVCLSERDWPDGGRCSRPFAMMQDVGAAFGPRKIDLAEWEKVPVWDDRPACRTSMDSLPYHGATFKPAAISEAGRRHLASLLGQLSDAQVEALFRGARFDQSKGFVGFRTTPIPEWVRVFKDKVRKITDGPPCPD
jgi:hypothetical protein